MITDLIDKLDALIVASAPTGEVRQQLRLLRQKVEALERGLAQIQMDHGSLSAELSRAQKDLELTLREMAQISALITRCRVAKDAKSERKTNQRRGIRPTSR